jgi:hypothetical protein
MSRRATSRSSVPYLPQGAASLVLDDSAVGERAAEALHEFVHPHHHPEDTLLEDSEDEDALVTREREQSSAKPWWKRPSAWW